MKMKKLVLSLVIALAVVLFPRVVSAAPSASNWQLYCGDISETVSKEDPVYCYLIAQITNDGKDTISRTIT